jgi:AmpD protein
MINRFPEIVTELAETADKKTRSPTPIVGIIIHHTDIGPYDPKNTPESKWRELFKSITKFMTLADDTYASAHFHIGRFGECAQLADPDTHEAYHAGVSSYYHPVTRRVESSWNKYAVGIELLGDGNKGFYSEAQYEKLSKLCAALMKRYGSIDPRCITGHENIAPTRKVDPGRFFDWRKFFYLLHKELIV